VWCSHKVSIAVIRPSSVGSVPDRLFPNARLQIRTQWPTSVSYAHPYVKWRESVSTGGVLSQDTHRRHPSELCGERSVQTVGLHPAADRQTASTISAYGHVKWREHASTGAVLSQLRQRRQQSQLCRQRAVQRIAVESPVMFSHPAHKSQRSKSTTRCKWRERMSTGAVLSQCYQRRQ
jgi:hypothetical protein